MKNYISIFLLTSLLFSCGGDKDDPSTSISQNKLSVSISGAVNSNLNVQGNTIQAINSAGTIQITATSTTGELLVLLISNFSGSGNYTLSEDNESGNAITYSSVGMEAGGTSTFISLDGSITIEIVENGFKGSFECSAEGGSDTGGMETLTMTNGTFEIKND